MEFESVEESRKRIEQEMTYVKETLFKAIPSPDPSWHLNATLDLGAGDWDAYALGYKEIADIAVDKLLEQQHMPDYQAYPVVFLYRHYLELRLKELLIVSSRLLNEDAEVPGDHRLAPLWKQVRPNLEQLWNDAGSLAYNDAIAARLDEFDAVDPWSFAFRYPVDKKGATTLQGLRIINVKHVRDVVTAISHMLDGSSTGIDEYLNAKHEMMAEYAAEMRQYRERGDY